MGCITSAPETANNIQETAIASNTPEKNPAEKTSAPKGGVYKLLLLGAGDSGKSTTFRQVVSLYGEGFSYEQRKSFIPLVYKNVIEGMQMLIKLSEGSTSVSDAAAIAMKAVRNISSEAKLTPEYAKHIGTLWSDAGIRKCYDEIGLSYLPDSADYFFSRLDSVSSPGYVPSFDDIIHVRARTSGIQSINFSLGEDNFQLVDVGGQRNERKKWKKSFENVGAVIFMVSLPGYDMNLFEDESSNRLEEGLKLFSEISNSKFFRSTKIFLFLNKSDRFREKIAAKPLKETFPDFEGGADFDKSVEYIKKLFLDKVLSDRERIFTHITCATDGVLVGEVIEKVRSTVAQ